jgi:hypothetical protein
MQRPHKATGNIFGVPVAQKSFRIMHNAKAQANNSLELTASSGQERGSFSCVSCHQAPIGIVGGSSVQALNETASRWDVLP